MSYEQLPPTDTERAGSTRRRRGLRTAVAVAAVSLVAAGVAGVAYASESSPSPSASEGPGGYGAAPNASGGPHRGPGGYGIPGGAWGMRGGPAAGGPGGLGGTVLHSLSVVAGKDGTTTTVATQRGTVTAISGSSVTVKSTDGYTATYQVTKDTTFMGSGAQTLQGLKKGDTVQVSATVKGSTSTATRIVSGTFDRGSWPGMRGQGPSSGGWPSKGPRPTPSASPSAS